MQFGLTLTIGLVIMTIIGFIVGVHIKYYNKVNLKFHNKEIDVADVTFNYRDILKEM